MSHAAARADRAHVVAAVCATSTVCVLLERYRLGRQQKDERQPRIADALDRYAHIVAATGAVGCFLAVSPELREGAVAASGSLLTAINFLDRHYQRAQTYFKGGGQVQIRDIEAWGGGGGQGRGTRLRVTKVRTGCGGEGGSRCFPSH